MAANQEAPRGLTRLILESLLAADPDTRASGETVDHRLLDQVERRVHQSLAPQGGGRERLVFDLVFKRAFAEARDRYLELAAVVPLSPAGSGLGRRRATA